MISFLFYLQGAIVIGSAGSDEKCALLKTWGFDHVINYKTTDVATALQDAAPHGIDLYFDNVRNINHGLVV